MEGHIFELHRACFRGIGTVPLLQMHTGIQHLTDALGGYLGRGHEHDDHDHHHNGHDDIGGIGAEHHNIAEGVQTRGRVGGRHIIDDGGPHPVDHQGQGVHGQGDAGQQEGESPLVKELGVHQLLIAFEELGVLVVLGVVGVDHIDAGEIFPGQQVDMVHQLLHPAEPGKHHAEDHQHHHQQGKDKARGDGRQGPALMDDLDDGPHRHDGGLDQDLQPHGQEHLNLGDVVGAAGDKAGHGEHHHLLLAEVRDLVKDLLPEGVTEPGRHPGGKIAADDAQHRAGQGTPQHLGTGAEDVRHGALRRLDEHGEVAHVVGQGQVEVDLSQDQQGTDGGHAPLPPPHFTKQL